MVGRKYEPELQNNREGDVHTIPDWIDALKSMNDVNKYYDDEETEEYLWHIKEFAEKYCPEALKGEKNE